MIRIMMTMAVMLIAIIACSDSARQAAPTNPTAKAGQDIVVESGVEVRLDASQSSDPNSKTLTYTWTQVSGPTVLIQDQHQGEVYVFDAPDVTSTSLWIFELTIHNGEFTDIDQIQVTVNPPDLTSPEIVGRIPDIDETNVAREVIIEVKFDEPLNQTTELLSSSITAVNTDTTVAIAGTISYDPVSFTLKFTLDAGVKLNPRTTYTVALTDAIQDEKGNLFAATSWDFTTTFDGAPYADAGISKYASLGADVFLDGSNSTVTVGQISYSWVQTAGPSVNLQGGTTAAPFFIPVPGEVATYQFDLTVTDGVPISDTDSVTITVLEDASQSMFIDPLSGDNNNLGTSDSALETIAGAYTLNTGRANPYDIYLLQGNYAFLETLNIVDGVSIYGGFTKGLDIWERVRVNTDQTLSNTIIEPIDGIAEPLPSMVLADNIGTTTTISGLEVHTSNGQDNSESPDPIPGGNSIVIVAKNSNSNLIVKNNYIVAGIGGSGSSGIDGARGENGVNGGPLLDPGGLNTNLERMIGGIHSCTFNGKVIDVSGGDGGGRGSPCSSTAEDGTPGSQPPPLGGTAGTGGVSNCLSITTAATNGGEGSTITADAKTGSGGNGIGSIEPTSVVWQPAPGGTGANGAPGHGGGGGGGIPNMVVPIPANPGAEGTGGGSGSCGGLRGTGGQGGGSSIGIYSIDSDIEIKNNVIDTSSGGGIGGEGGNGGISGSVGLPPLFPICRTNKIIFIGSTRQCGTQGESGGRGGNGGAGGGGAGGSNCSVMLALKTTSEIDGAMLEAEYLAQQTFTLGVGGNGGLGGQSPLPAGNGFTGRADNVCIYNY